jgi:hypothetical protein
MIFSRAGPSNLDAWMIAFAVTNTWDVLQYFLAKRASFRYFQRRHKKVYKLVRVNCGWRELSKLWIISGIEWLVAARIPVSINHGEQNHPALEKWQRKKHVHFIFCVVTPEEFSCMCLENLLALLPVGTAFLRSLQAKVCTRGAMCLSCQTWFRRTILCGWTIFYRCLASCLARWSGLLKQCCLYTLLEEKLPTGRC